MNCRISLFAIVILFSGVIFAEGLSQEELPNGDEVIARYIEVTGGRKKYKSIKTGKLVTKSVIGGKTGIKLTSNMTVRLPNQFYQKITMGGEFYMERGSDGQVMWSKDKQDNYSIKKNEDANYPIPFLTMRNYTNPERYYRSRETLGKVSVNGESCFAVKSTAKDGSERTECFSEKTGLLVRVSLVAGESKTRNVYLYTEYFKTSVGVLFPKVLTLKEPFAGVTTNEGFEINSKVDTSFFELPAEVKKLVKK